MRRAGLDVALLKQQIGVMVLAGFGARDFATDGTSLLFRVGATRRRRKIMVTLASDDTYTVQAWRVVGGNDLMLGEANGVYADSVGEVVQCLATEGR